MTQQCRGPTGGIEARQGQRIEQLLDGGAAEWRELQRDESVCILSRRPGAQRCRQLHGPRCQQPLDWLFSMPAPHGQCGHELQRGRVGKLHVVECDREESLRCFGAQGLLDGLTQSQWLQLARRAGAQFRQDACDLWNPCTPRRDAPLLECSAQHARHGGVGHGGVAGARAHDMALMAGSKVREQARLANAGLADDEHGLPEDARLDEPVPFRFTADQPRRPQHRHRSRRGGACAGYFAVLDQALQVLRLTIGQHPKFGAQQQAAAVESGQRSSAVSAQIVQPHHAPMGVFLCRIELDQSLAHAQCRGNATFAFES